eukprot:7689217-Pyramimonas_sp.AAC.1
MLTLPQKTAEAEKRLNDLKQIFAEQAKTMFGAVKDRAEALKREHEVQTERPKKKRKQDEPAEGTSNTGGADPGSSAPAAGFQ